MGSAISRVEQYGWILVMGILVVFTIPWFLWGDDHVIIGLPLWLWWHICWMGLATVVFSLFANRAWGMGITDTAESGLEEGEQV